ncbi:MAG: leucine-rich repeat protein [Muribaculaceae bacterium]|nr:leucine-rich repeat protein [Muribaculaceae bacterium]
MKKSLILFATMLTALAASALDFEDGYYKFTTISSTAVECKGFTPSASGSVTSINVPGQVWNASEQKRYQVKRIAASAFANQTQVTSAYVCYGVESIDNYAFQNCTNLGSVWLHSSVSTLGIAVFSGDTKMVKLCFAGEKPFYCSSYSFEGMSRSTQLVVATQRGVNACKNNSVISSQFPSIVWNLDAADIVMPDGYFYNVTKAPPLDGFYGEAKLIGFRLPSSNTTGTDTVYEYNVTAIDDSCAASNTQVKILDLSEVSHLTKVGKSAFEECTNLTTVKMGGNALIGMWAFNGCTALTSVDLKGVYKIQNYAFMNNTALTTVEIPSSLTEFNVLSFKGASSLASYTVNSNSTLFSAYQGVLYNKDKTRLIACPPRCSMGGAEVVILPATVRVVGANAFDSNTVLKSIEINDGVTEIQDQAFATMPALHTIRIPESVTEIGSEAFCDCTGLSEIHTQITNPANVTLGDYVFYGVPKNTCKLYVPSGSLQLYKKAAQWKDFLNIVEEGGLQGDVNGDGKVNVSDVTALVNMILGVIPKDEARADVNGDGKINVSDVTALINIILS